MMSPTPDPKARSLAEVVDDVPPMPQVAQKVLEMTRGGSEVAVADLVRVVSSDQGLTTKVLRTCNSPYFGLRQQVKTLTQAVVLLGIRTVRSLVLLHSLPVHAKGRPTFEQTAMWSHGVGAALAGRFLATKVPDLDPEEAFLGGLLHDVGRQVLALGLGETYLEIFRAIYRREVPSVEGERKVLGFDHAQVGALVTEKWCFPQELAEVVGGHHDPVESMDGLKLVVRAADELVHRMGIGIQPLEEDEMGPGLQRLGLDAEELEAMSERIRMSLEQEMSLFRTAA
jgi:putative nucleotidyltransferase with HDIG domain